MSSKRDNIKKALGITEYPWSSDDEDQSGMLDLHLLRRQTAEPRLSVSDMPGISGLAPRPSTSSSSSVPTRRSQTQAKMDRALYWSALNNAKKAATLGVSRLSDVPMSCLSRSVTHTPAAEFRGRGERSNPRADIQRVLAFKKLTSTLNNLRQSNANSNLYSMSSRGNTGPLLPSEVSSNARSPMIPDEVHAICSRMKTSHEPSSCRSANARMSRGVRTGEEPLAASYATSRSRALNPNSPGVGHGSAAPALPRVNIGNTDDETENPGGSTSLPIERDEVNLDRSAEVVASSGGGIILEEEIVEVQAPEEVTAAVHHDAIDHTEEPDNPVTNEVIISQSAEPLAQQHHGLKRKRESHDDADPGPVSVNEFNQDLLRLLECPVCLEWMEPPMSQCRRGHLVCGRCRERLAACPVCRTTFSSVRNRAMEGVAELLRYPCRHGCGRELRLRRRAPHEASCGARKYTCPAPLCTDRQPLARSDLGPHFQSKHLQMVRIGNKHKFSIKVNFEQHENWLIFAWDEYFHLRIDVDIRTWGVIVYVAYIGPKWNCTNFTYEVSLGEPNSRKLIYSRVTHSDLESPTVNVSRQDCFHLTIDQALNFLRFKNRHCEPDKYLDFNLQITNLQQTPADSRDS